MKTNSIGNCWQGEYDQSDLPDVIILLKVIAYFAKKMITKYITKYSSNCKVCIPLGAVVQCGCSVPVGRVSDS